MDHVGADLLAVSMAFAACAGTAAPAREPASAASTQARSECRQSAQPASPWREMTWAEYYADVRERAAGRGVEVIWITPPDVREPRRGEPSTTPLASCTR